METKLTTKGTQTKTQILKQLIKQKNPTMKQSTEHNVFGHKIKIKFSLPPPAFIHCMTKLVHCSEIIPNHELGKQKSVINQPSQDQKKLTYIVNKNKNSDQNKKN